MYQVRTYCTSVFRDLQPATLILLKSPSYIQLPQIQGQYRYLKQPTCELSLFRFCLAGVASSPIVPSSNTASGRGSGQGRGRSGSRGCGNRHGSRAITTPRVRSTFKGNTEEMNGHVFQCFNKCEDKKHFSKTVEALGEHIAKKLKYPGDMVSLTKDFVKPEIPKPKELEVSERKLACYRNLGKGVCLLYAH